MVIISDRISSFKILFIPLTHNISIIRTKEYTNYRLGQAKLSTFALGILFFHIDAVLFVLDLNKDVYLTVYIYKYTNELIGLICRGVKRS